jgi:hypothetical protein
MGRDFGPTSRASVIVHLTTHCKYPCETHRGFA